MSSLSLRSKTLIFSVTMLLVTMVATKLILQRELTGSFAAAERNDMARAVQRGKVLVDDVTDQLDRLTRDWAHWDDMYAFMQSGNLAFRRSNLRSDTLRDLQVNQVLLLTSRGKVIYTNCLSREWHPQNAPPAALLAQVAPGGRLLTSRPTHGLLATADGPLVVASWPILPSDGAGAPRGTLIFGRFLGETEIKHLSKLGNLQLQVVPLSVVPAAKPLDTPADRIIVIAPVSATQITGYLPLPDLAGPDALALKVTSPRELYLQGQQTVADFSGALVVIIGLSGALLLLGLELLVLRRVARASAALEQVAATGEVAARVPHEGDDELGRLTAGINRALAALEHEANRQQAAATEIEHLRQLLDSVIAHAPLAMFAKEFPSGNHIIWNQAAEQLYGRTAAEVLGQDDYRLFPRERAELLRARDRVAIETGEVVDSPEEAIVTPAGETRLLHTRKVPMPPFGNAEGYVVCIAEDVTEYRLQQAHLQRTLEELARSNTELEQFAYVASHDLQEPLRMIASYVQLLARRYQGQLDADADDFIGFAVDGATRMQGLINDLLAYSRVGTQGREFTTVSLEDALATALQNLQVALDEDGATVTHAPLPRIWGDEGQLVQLLQNLVANALKFRREQAPRIQITAERDGDEWLICVRDNGIGIEPQYLHRIFVIFQGCTPGRNTPAQALAWPSANVSSSVTEDAFGQNQSLLRAPPSVSPCPPTRRTDDGTCPWRHRHRNTTGGR